MTTALVALTLGTPVGHAQRHSMPRGQKAPVEQSRPPAARTPPVAPALTNADVTVLVEAGLPDAVIIEKIRQGPTAFDTSPSALVALKRADVSTAVIQVMVNPDADPGGPAGAGPGPEACGAPTGGPPTYLTGASTAMWYATSAGDKRVEMQYERGTIQDVGFAGVGARLLLLKPKSGQLRLPSGTIFYSCFNPTETPLVKFTVDEEDDERHTSVGRTMLWKHSFRISDGDLVPITFTKTPQGLFEVKTRSPLSRGEYGFVPQVGSSYFTAGERVFAFGVE